MRKWNSNNTIPAKRLFFNINGGVDLALEEEEYKEVWQKHYLIRNAMTTSTDMQIFCRWISNSASADFTPERKSIASFALGRDDLDELLSNRRESTLKR